MVQRAYLAAVSALLLIHLNAFAQTSALPRSSPEEEGVSSVELMKFLEATGNSKTEFHSFMLVRHG